MPTADPTFARFFRAVEGKLAPRYGTATATSPNLWIGASRDDKGQLVWDTKTIHPITHREAQRYSREYNRLVRDKALVECTLADWQQQQKEAKEAKRKAQEKANAEAAKAAEAQQAADQAAKTEPS